MIIIIINVEMNVYFHEMSAIVNIVVNMYTINIYLITFVRTDYKILGIRQTNLHSIAPFRNRFYIEGGKT